MKFKLFILISLLFVAIIAINASINTPVHPKIEIINIPAHTFSNFEKDTVIKTDIINTKPKTYSSSYQVFYQIEEANQPTIDVLFEIDKQKSNASIEIRNITSQKEIDITDGKQLLYKNVPTDWAGHITIDNIKISNKICVILNMASNQSPQICHTIEGVSHA